MRVVVGEVDERDRAGAASGGAPERRCTDQVIGNILMWSAKAKLSRPKQRFGRLVRRFAPPKAALRTPPATI